MKTKQEEAAAGRDTSLAKGLAVLAAVIDNDRSRADSLAEVTGLPLSSVYRYLRVLRDAGFVVEEDAGYSVGARIDAHRAGLSESRLAEIATPFLRHLAEVAQETAVLTVRHGMHAVCLRQIESAQDIRLAFRVGQLLPLYAGAGQRVLLAQCPDAFVKAVADQGMRTFTPSTPSREELMASIKVIRRAGFAISRGELTPGSVAIAVPVLVEGRAACSLTLAGPANRCNPAWQAVARAELESAAESLAHRLEAA